MTTRSPQVTKYVICQKEDKYIQFLVQADREFDLYDSYKEWFIATED